MKSEESMEPNRLLLATTICPRCDMIWLTPGLVTGDTYECKRCGFVFVIGEKVGDDRANPGHTPV